MDSTRRIEIDEALQRESECAEVDFKSSFDPNQKGELLEVIKDIVAMANSGGGIIIFGLQNDGTPSGVDLSGIQTFDPAKITDCIYKYTDLQFQDFKLLRIDKAGKQMFALLVGAATMPIVFSQTGNYQDAGRQQRNAFLGGTVYFRHGAKSEPGNTNDLRSFLENRVDEVRRAWLDGIAKVVEAPSGSVIQVLRPGAAQEPASAIRITTDPSAPSLPVGLIDQAWPFRQKEVIAEVNKILTGSRVINPNHVLYVRRAFGIETNGEFCYTQKHVSPKYSQAFVDWLVAQFKSDSEFFEKAKLIAEQKRSLATTTRPTEGAGV